jgi:hypothetical protein
MIQQRLSVVRKTFSEVLGMLRGRHSGGIITISRALAARWAAGWL